MRNTLNSEIRKERCNQQALGLFNAGVSVGINQSGKPEDVFNEFNTKITDFVKNPPTDVFRYEENKKGDLEIVRYSLRYNKYSNSLGYLKNGRQNSKGFTINLAHRKLTDGELRIKK